MKRALCLLWTACLIPHTWGQDFAAKFMEQCTKKGQVECQTVSPKMMEKVMETITRSDEREDTGIPEYLLSKLKSARIITAKKGGEKLFQKAERLMEKNKNRFSPMADYAAGEDNMIFVRKHNETVQELVMLSLSAEKTLTIVNLTGDMDEKFMRVLSSEKIKTD